MTNTSGTIQFRRGVEARYPDVYTPDALNAITTLAPINDRRREVMTSRTARRARRARDREPIGFLDPAATIAGTAVRVQDARDGKFHGSAIPADLLRQWVQGTGPAARPNVAIDKSLRNVAYALLSGADGWMFDGEDAL